MASASPTDLHRLQRELHDIKLQKAAIASAMRQKERHTRRLERLAAARRESAAKLAEATAQERHMPGNEDEDMEWDAVLEDLQRKEQYIKAMDEPMWTGPPPWVDPSKWSNVSGMQWLYKIDSQKELVVAKREPMNLKILAQPFAHGSSHLAYFALDSSGRKMVAKRQLYEPASARSGVRDMQAYVHGHTVTCRLADAFRNRASYQQHVHEGINIEPVTLVVVKGAELRPTPCDGATQVVLLLEPWLEGHFQKWVSNDGNIMQNEAALEAFAHFSYEHSKTEGRAVMVLDLQGVRRSEGVFRLTDPAMASASRMFGPTDMGSAAIEKFLEQHTCNFLCP